MNEVPFFIATILAKLLSGKYIFSTILTPVRKNTHTYENIFPLVWVFFLIGVSIVPCQNIRKRRFIVFLIKVLPIE